jgi:hypothetical protein
MLGVSDEMSLSMRKSLDLEQLATSNSDLMDYNLKPIHQDIHHLGA